MNDDIMVFAETNFRNARRRFGIKKDDRRRHVYVIGKTGSGKTTLLENMVISDILAGNGVGVIDPHGEFAEKILDFVPKERIDDVIYFNPSDLLHPIAFNPIEEVGVERRHLVASGLMGVFKKIWPDVWSARMEYILNNTILALLESPGSTLLSIMRMLSNKHYRKGILEHVKDPVIRSFWLDEFARYHDRFEVEAIAPIQNKVGQFLSSGIIRNIVGQGESAFDVRSVMDEGKILIMNLSKGKIGEDSSRLLGGLLVAKLQLAAMSRIDTPDSERRDFYLYVDEFQNFATESFASILSEARKYRLNLILANQYIAQLTETSEGVRKTTVRDAVFGNVGTIMAFRVGADDAEFLEKEFEPEFVANDLVNLPNFNIYLKLMIDGVTSWAFSAATLPPYKMPERSYKEEIIERSRQLYSRDRDEVEKEIAQWAGEGMIIGKDDSSKRSSKPRDFSSPATTKNRKASNSDTDVPFFETDQGQRFYEAICWEGGEKVLVSFKPDGKRPIFCKKHSSKMREARGFSGDIPKPVSLKEAIGSAKETQNKLTSGKKEKPQPKAGPPRAGKRRKEAPVDSDKLREVLTEARRSE